MKFNSLKEALQFRMTENEDDYWIEDFWKSLIEIALKDVDQTIQFIRVESSDEEFYWISEVFDDIAGKTQSIEFIEALRTRLKKVTRENYRQENFKSKFMRQYIDYDTYIEQISHDIDFAQGVINLSQEDVAD